MMAGHPKLKTMLLTGITLLLLNACGTTAPTRFYILSPMPDAGTSSPVERNDDLSIVLAPVRLPEHLNRPQIVTRQSGHRITVDEFNRWAEPLDTAFAVILAENLSLLLGTDRISVTNRLRNIDANYLLSVDVMRFDGWPGGEATLVCRWSLDSGAETSGPTFQRFTATRPVKGDGYPGFVAALNGMLSDLSREIAARILSDGR